MTSSTTTPTKKKLESFSLVDGPLAIGSFELAREIGWPAVHFIQQLHFLLQSDALRGYIDRQGHKWVWNTPAAWAEMLAHAVGAIESAIKKLIELKIIVGKKCQAFRCNHTMHYRINYAVLWAFLKEKGLKPSDNAWPLFEGIEEEVKPASTTQKDPGQYKDFLRRFASKSKQQGAALVAAFSKRSVSNTDVLPDEEASPPPAARSAPKPKEHSVNRASEDKANLPPAAADDPERRRQLVLRLRECKPNPVNETAIKALLEDFSCDEIEQQLAWLPARKPRDEASVLIKALRDPGGPWGAPPTEKQATVNQQKSDSARKISDFIAQLVPKESKIASPLGTVYKFMRIVSDATLWVCGEDGKEGPLPVEAAMNWGLAV